MTKRIAVLLILAASLPALGQKRERTRHPRRSNRESYLWTAQYKDGLHTFAKHPTGACSHHGGVAQWIKPQADI
jgi:hypothetical protein